MGKSSVLKRPEGLRKPDFRFWQISAPPPNRKEAMKWLAEQKKDKDTGIQKADPGELDQFSQVCLKHLTKIIIILRAWCSSMARLRRINMGGSIPKNKSRVMSNMKYNL